jgi:shikimate kinase
VNIAIFGFMGVGKSSVGRLVAEALGMEFVDIDDTIVTVAGIDITSIFKERGEKGFRELEKNATEKISAMEGVVISCGGGTVLDKGNLKALKRTSRMILLTANSETILQRVQVNGDTRPLLTNEEKEDSISRLLRERTPQYLEAADHVVDTSGKTQAQVAHEIIERLQEDR